MECYVSPTRSQARPKPLPFDRHNAMKFLLLLLVILLLGLLILLLHSPLFFYILCSQPFVTPPLKMPAPS
jgi:hypothetical protein